MFPHDRQFVGTGAPHHIGLGRVRGIWSAGQWKMGHEEERGQPGHLGHAGPTRRNRRADREYFQGGTVGTDPATGPVPFNEQHDDIESTMGPTSVRPILFLLVIASFLLVPACSWDVGPLSLPDEPDPEEPPPGEDDEGDDEGDGGFRGALTGGLHVYFA